MQDGVYLSGHSPSPSGEVLQFHRELARQGGAGEYAQIKLTVGTNSQTLPRYFKPIMLYPSAPESSQFYPKVGTTKLRQDAAREIEELSQTVHQEKWDGEGATKLSAQTSKIALELVAMFPHHVLGDYLDIDATPFGSIDFGWVLDRDVMMNVIVLPSGEIGFAYSVHGERKDGKVLWEGTLPGCISEAFGRVFNREESDG